MKEEETDSENNSCTVQTLIKSNRRLQREHTQTGRTKKRERETKEQRNTNKETQIQS